MMATKTMSKRILGVGIIASGILVLSIALILGIKFPQFVQEKAMDDVCIVDKEHSLYNRWVRNPLANQIFFFSEDCCLLIV